MEEDDKFAVEEARVQRTEATCCKEKAVLVTVYVERPRIKRKVSQNHHHHHHHHHHHLRQTIKRELILHNQGPSGKGYDRRAQLLQYSQHLRESARSETRPPQPSPLKPTSSSNQKPTSEIVAVQTQSKRPGTPACRGSRKILIPNFFRSLTSSKAKKERKKKKQSGSISNTIKPATKSLEMPKRKRGFISNCFSAFQKHS
ncbi:uncharacterized protein LOC133854046 [Alnus glutinosa]|uniref:uncharacterized protein LOC133854046 n=1 Tax=Alnus glutinosa TaxID=3517 RepID=UPI002D7A165F|nr:uncharacterized protein LOC133854046 [Alnus glutinosa]